MSDQPGAVDLEALKRYRPGLVPLLGYRKAVERVLVPPEQWDAIIAALERAERVEGLRRRAAMTADAFTLDVLRSAAAGLIDIQPAYVKYHIGELLKERDEVILRTARMEEEIRRLAASLSGKTSRWTVDPTVLPEIAAALAPAPGEEGER